MDKLSESLLAIAAKYGMAYDDADVMDAAAKLARRVEEAPVGQAVGQSGPLPGYAAAIVLMEDPARIKGQRVRLVREQES